MRRSTSIHNSWAPMYSRFFLSCFTRPSITRPAVPASRPCRLLTLPWRSYSLLHVVDLVCFFLFTAPYPSRRVGLISSSTRFYIFDNHSTRYSSLLNCLDYLGIIILMWGARSQPSTISLPDSLRYYAALLWLSTDGGPGGAAGRGGRGGGGGAGGGAATAQ